MSFRKMAGFAGLAFVVLFVTSSFVYGGEPLLDWATPTAGVEQIAGRIFEHGSGSYLLAGALRAFGAVALIPFAAGFAMPFFTSDREHYEGFGVLIVAALVAASTTIGAALAALTTFGLWVEDLDESSMRALWDLSKAAYAFSILLVIPAAGGAAAAIMRHGMMPRWFGYLSGVVALLGLSAIAGFLEFKGDEPMVVLAGFLGILGWVLTASIVMIREPAA